MIRFAAFSKTFGTHRAVRELTLTIGVGEVVALLGPNGSGKTTTLKAAAGLTQPTSGQVLLGDPGRAASEALARTLISFLPQRVSFPESLSGREVVEFYRQLRKLDPGRTDAALRFASLNGSSLRQVGTYSGGMTQRLGLAVATLPDAPVLLLDEPTAALDPEGLTAFYSVVEARKREGRTVLFTSHQLGDAERLADRFVILVDGKLVGDLSAVELAGRLAERGVLRLQVSRATPDVLGAAQRLAPGSRFEGETLVVPGPASLRSGIVEAVTSAGGGIRTLMTEEGRLDDFYRELVAGSREQH